MFSKDKNIEYKVKGEASESICNVFTTRIRYRIRKKISMVQIRKTN